MLDWLQGIVSALLMCVVLATPPIIIWLVRTKDAPWNTTSWQKVQRMLELSKLQPGETVYDLGAGDGRIVIVAAKKFNARAIGVEIDFLRCALTKLLIRLNGQAKQVTIIHGDMFEQDIRDADVVTLFLIPKTMEPIQQMLETQLKPGARVVSHRFALPGWQPVTYSELDDVYLYVFGEESRPDSG